MRKGLLLLLLAAMLGGNLYAQSYEGTIEYDKKKNTAYQIDFGYPQEAVENAITQYFDKMGYKPKEEKGILNRDKGFKVYRSVFFNDVSTNSMDYLFKVERKSRKDKESSVLYMVVQKDGNLLNPVDADIASRAKNFLNNLAPAVEAANLELQIAAQEEVVAKAEKKLAGLKDDHDTLTKKLADNEKNQTDTQKDIENQKMRLGELKGQRKN